MKHPVEICRRLAAGAMLLLALAPSALALEALTITVPAGTGGGWDQTGRSMSQAMTASGTVKTVQVSNIPGAGGTIGLARVINTHKGDGRSLMVTGAVMVGAALTNKSPVSLSQTTPIARLTGEYLVVVVPAASPHKTLADLTAAMRADPAKVAWAGGSAGGIDHILVGLYAEAVGADPKRINYVAFSGGGEALAALLGNHVAAGVSGWNEFASQIASGKLRAIAVSSPERLPGIDVPSFKEQGVALEVANWRGVVAPPGLKPADREALAAAVETMARSPDWKQVLEKNGWMDLYQPSDAFAAFIEAEQRRVEGVLRQIGLVQ